MVGLDSFQPLGVKHPLVRNGPLRWYWRRVAEPLGLAGHRPVLAARRRVPTIWELVSRGGAPVAAVSVSGPTVRIDDDLVRVLGQKTSQLARKITADLGGVMPPVQPSGA